MVAHGRCRIGDGDTVALTSSSAVDSDVVFRFYALRRLLIQRLLTLLTRVYRHSKRAKEKGLGFGISRCVSQRRIGSLGF